VFIVYFLKNNTSLRQNTFKNLSVRVRSLISCSNWCLFESLWIRTWLGEVTSKIGLKKGVKQRPDAGPDAESDAVLLHHCVWSPRPLVGLVISKNFSRICDRTLHRTRRCDHRVRSRPPPPRPIMRLSFPGNLWPDSVSIRSSLTGRVRSLQELTRLWPDAAHLVRSCV
jgi:hypothetical protein